MQILQNAVAQQRDQVSSQSFGAIFRKNINADLQPACHVFGTASHSHKLRSVIGAYRQNIWSIWCAFRTNGVGKTGASVERQKFLLREPYRRAILTGRDI